VPEASTHAAGQPGGEVREHDRRRRHPQRREHDGDDLRERPKDVLAQSSRPCRGFRAMLQPMDWPEIDGALEKEFELESFPAAIAFVDRLAEVAEAENHHPDIDIRYRRVLVRWSTHSAGGVTDRDRALAARTDELV
jgi:4a-hydroxytetrahydrobiopterin dehydratase